jgi:hypothetical protein
MAHEEQPVQGGLPHPAHPRRQGRGGALRALQKTARLQAALQGMAKIIRVALFFSSAVLYFFVFRGFFFFPALCQSQKQRRFLWMCRYGTVNHFLHFCGKLPIERAYI